MKKALVIAIDGPAASGKGTLAKKIAAHFGFSYLDTGKLYRAVALGILNAGDDPHNITIAVKIAKKLAPEELARVELGEERVGQAASIVASIPEVRAVLLDFQRNFAKNKQGAVLDGRDIGTVICPHADIKLFIHADVHTRAERRHKELQQRGTDITYNTVLNELQERDTRDSTRDVAPMKTAADAVIIDTTLMDANQVFLHAKSLITGYMS